MRKLALYTFAVAAALNAVGFVLAAEQLSSAEGFVKEVVAAIGNRDQAALGKLAIDQAEFKRYIWPSIARRVSGGNMNADKYFTVYQKSSQVGMTEGMESLGGHRWEVVKISAEPGAKGKGYQVYNAPVITLRDDGGKETSLRFIGGMLERDGAFKVTTFYVSPTQRAAK